MTHKVNTDKLEAAITEDAIHLVGLTYDAVSTAAITDNTLTPAEFAAHLNAMDILTEVLIHLEFDEFHI